MGVDQVAFGRRLDPEGDDGSGGGNEPVDQNRPVRLRRAQHGPGHHRDFESAIFRQRLRGTQVRGGPRCGGFENGRLVRQAGVVQPGAAPGKVGEREAEQLVGEERRRGGVADTHFAEAQDIGRAFFGKLPAGPQGVVALRPGHCRLNKAVAGTRPDAPLHEIGVVDRVAGNTGIDHPHGCADRFGKDAGRRTAVQKVQDHFPGDGLGIGRHAFRRDTVVRHEDGQFAGVEPGRDGSGRARQLQPDRLDLPQGAERLGLAVDQVPDGPLKVGVRAGIAIRHGIRRRPVPSRLLPASCCPRPIALCGP